MLVVNVAEHRAWDLVAIWGLRPVHFEACLVGQTLLPESANKLTFILQRGSDPMNTIMGLIK